MVRVDLGGQLDFAERISRQGLEARIEQNLNMQEKQLVTTTSDGKPLLTTIADGILHDQGATLILASALGTSIILFAIAKAAAEIITVCRKK
ncbi:MAG: hypothetical protein ACKO2V_08780 [Snowella sp.]